MKKTIAVLVLLLSISTLASAGPITPAEWGRFLPPPTTTDDFDDWDWWWWEWIDLIFAPEDPQPINDPPQVLPPNNGGIFVDV